MIDEGGSKKRCRRRGRPRIHRFTVLEPAGCCYKPCDAISDNTEKVTLRIEELEILRLIDLNGLTQEDAAFMMGISRRSLWRDLHETRRKVTDALVNGKIIQIEGCEHKNSQQCTFLTSSEEEQE